MDVLLDAAFTCVAIFLAPALAVHPRLIDSPMSAVGIPVCSVFVLLVTLIPALHVNLVSHDRAKFALYVLTAISAARVFFRVRRREARRVEWNADAAFAILLALGLSVFVAGRMSLWGFDSDDEIYSWNKWAIDIIPWE